MGIAWHAPYELLTPETQDLARAIHSLMEELEAIDWYGQRMDVTHDQDLRRILEHNRDEEKEHACMVLEWIRRHDPKFDEHLRTYLFTAGDILEVEKMQEAAELAAEATAKTEPATAPEIVPEMESLSLTVGSLRPRRT
jgi:ferritin-like protein